MQDVGSSKWGGGYKRDGTWLEYAKNFPDLLNGCALSAP
jgi:hypothetical protein